MSENDDVSMKDETGGTEEEEVEDSSGIDEEADAGEEILLKAKQAITCRNITLNTLMEDGMIEAGKGVLSIDYLGQRFEADLLPSGKIKWHGSENEFGTPSAWALHCKRLVNPIKRSGCGWASVKYKNKKLDIWKSIWARKLRTSTSTSSTPFKSPSLSPGQGNSHVSPQSTSASSADVLPASENGKILMSTPVKAGTSPLKAEEEASVCKVLCLSPVAVVPSTNSLKPDLLPQMLLSPVKNVQAVTETKRECEQTDTESNKASVAVSDEPKQRAPKLKLKLPQLSPPRPDHPEATTNVSLSLSEDSASITTKKPEIPALIKDNQRNPVDVVLKERKCVSYSSLEMRTADSDSDIDFNTIVSCEHFDSSNKLQPFTVSLTTNAALLMDFHCHLTRSEVVGYLGGKWDPHRSHLSIEQSFPVLCRLGDTFKAPLVEDEIRRRMKARKMTLVGWYHSHPYCAAQPSIRDIDCQMSYQLKMRGSGSTYQPCIGFIEAPFEKTEENTTSSLRGFWVMPNLERPSSYNIPMHISFSLQRDQSLTEDILIDMRRLTEFYSGAPDRVRFKERWKDSVTYLDKIRTSLACKLPEDQLTSGTFLDYMEQLVKDMK